MSRVRSITAPIFFALFFLSGSILFSSQAHAACATPTASAGALEWFTADTKFKYCDGTNWNVVGAAGLWTLNGSDIHYTPGNVGVGWTNPVVALDVNGGIRFNDAGVPCNATYEGTLRYSSSNTIDFCDGTSWKSMAGEAVSTCAIQEYTAPGSYGYTVTLGCENLMIEAYGGGGGAGYAGQGGGGGGSSRVDNSVPATLALGGGGGAGGYDGAAVGSGGGGGYGKKIVTLTAGDNLTIVVGGGGQSACVGQGGPGGSPSGGIGGNLAIGGTSTYGGAGGGDSNYRGGNSTHGGGGGGGTNTSNSASATTNGGAGGTDIDFPCGTSTNGTTCGGLGEGGGGGAGLGDIILQGLSGDRFGGGTAANGGPGIGAINGTICPTTGGNGKVVIRPL